MPFLDSGLHLTSLTAVLCKMSITVEYSFVGLCTFNVGKVDTLIKYIVNKIYMYFVF